MAREQIGRSELIARLRHVRALIVEHNDYVRERKALAERMRSHYHPDYKTDRLREAAEQAHKKLFPDGTRISIRMIDFCINAIVTKQAGSMRYAVTLYEKEQRHEALLREQIDAQQEATRQARRNARDIMESATMDQMTSDFLYRK